MCMCVCLSCLFVSLSVSVSVSLSVSLSDICAFVGGSSYRSDLFAMDVVAEIMKVMKRHDTVAPLQLAAVLTVGTVR
jgi:hypothetical protein